MLASTAAADRWREPGGPGTTSRDGALTVLLHGEIHNASAVAARAGLAATGGDRQLLADLLAGAPGRVGELCGGFAFVAWDHRRRELLAGRDALGIAPLYVLRHRSGELTLATRLTALTGDTEATVVDRLGIGTFLAFGHTGPGLTAFEAVQKLQPGVLHHWQRAAVGLARSAERFTAAPAPAPDLVGALRAAVHARLGPVEVVGTFLDGGVPSTLLTHLASRERPGMPCYTALFPESAGDDGSATARHNAVLLGVAQHLVPTTLADLAAAARRLAEQHGEPFADPGALPLTHLSLAAGTNLRAVLCSEGAREVLGGSRPDRRGDLALLGRLDARAGADVAALTSSGWRTSAGSDRARAWAYDTEVLLQNRLLEGTAGALRLGGLQGRLPYLDPAVVAAARLPGTTRSPLRSLLLDLLPGVRLPGRSVRPSIDLRALVDQHFAEQVERQLVDPAAALSRWVGRPDRGAARQRADRSPAFAFRLAMLDQWQLTHGQPVVWQR